jgi:hypothetical protein
MFKSSYRLIFFLVTLYPNFLGAVRFPKPDNIEVETRLVFVEELNKYKVFYCLNNHPLSLQTVEVEVSKESLREGAGSGIYIFKSTCPDMPAILRSNSGESSFEDNPWAKYLKEKLVSHFLS